MDALVPVPPELLWDYDQAPLDLVWRLNRIGGWFPTFGRDRKTVASLHAHLGELDLPAETKQLIAMYEEAWREREQCDAAR